MKIKILSLIILAAWLSLICVSFSLAKTVSVGNTKNISILVPECKSKISQKAKAKVGQEEALIAEGFSVMNAPGEPAMPFKDISLIVPANTDTDSLQVILVGATKSEIKEGYPHNIAPAPPFATYINNKVVYIWGDENKHIDKEGTGRNQDTYAQDADYPKNNLQIVDIGNMRKWKIIKVRYYPYTYNPRSGRLFKTEGGNIQIDCKLNPSKGLSAKTMQDSALDDFAAKLTANFEQAKSDYPNPLAKDGIAPPPANPGYLILTTNYILNDNGNTKLQDFINHKKTRGFEVYVATEDAWGGGTTTDERANNIRKYLQNNYIDKNLKYVLLVGNPSPADNLVYPRIDGSFILFNAPDTYPINNHNLLLGDMEKVSVPMKVVYEWASYWPISTDYYYADLTGNWDLNGNGVYGEARGDYFNISADGTVYTRRSDGVDLIPEVIVGRIPFYGNFTDLDHILQKTIDYEFGVFNGDWMKNALISIMPSDKFTTKYSLGEQIKRDILDPIGALTTRIYIAGYDAYPPVEFTYDWLHVAGDTLVLAAWQKHAGIHIWAAHGGPTGAGNVFSITSCPSLDDRYPSFTFQSSCSNGWPYTEYNAGYQLLKNGAIVTDSASIYSRYILGETDFTNSGTDAGIAYQYTRNLMFWHLSCGDAHYMAMYTVPTVMFNPLCGSLFPILNNIYAFNIYGDPSLKYPIGLSQVPVSAKMEIHDIDNNITITNSKSVILKCYLEDASGHTGAFSKIKFSNDNITWSDEEGYKASKEWDLTPENGLRTVYAQILDYDGQWQSCSAQIYLDTEAKVTTAITVTPDVEWIDQPINISLSASDIERGQDCSNTAKIFYSLDGKYPTTEYTGPFTISKAGPTTIKCFSQGASGLKEDPIQSKVVGIDKDKPIETCLYCSSILCSSGSRTRSIRLFVFVKDYLSGIREAKFAETSDDLEKASFQPISLEYTSNPNWVEGSEYALTSFTLSSPGDGHKTIYAQFKDAAGNKSNVISCSTLLDTTAPSPPSNIVVRVADNTVNQLNIKWDVYVNSSLRYDCRIYSSD
ncbi:MAG: C25 family cysteine peptidase, partial [Candidatus Omnitrophota bacterium]